MGWITVLLSTPTITVYVEVPERSRYSPEDWRVITYLLDECGLEKDRMG